MSGYERSFVGILKNRLGEENLLIQVILGPRQVGKTTGVLQLIKKYKKPYHYASADDIISGDRVWIVEQWQKALELGQNSLLIIDEIQKIDNWSEVIKKLWDEQKIKKTNIKLVLLGSSSLSLSKGVSESLAGRFEIIEVFHWDFIETNKLRKLGVDDYLKFGGYPESIDLIDDYDRWRLYVKNSIIDTVINKDILHYASIKNPSLFRQAFEIICCYPSQEISYRKILGQLQDRGNVELIKNYLRLLEGAFLIKTLSKYSSQEFKLKTSSPKILILSPCFYEIVSTHKDKMDFVFESTVGAKLLQLSDSLYYWRKGNDEVDFILNWRGKIYAIEVKSGRKKRVSGLNKFLETFPDSIPVIINSDNYPKFIKTPDNFLELLS